MFINILPPSFPFSICCINSTFTTFASHMTNSRVWLLIFLFVLTCWFVFMWSIYMSIFMVMSTSLLIEAAKLSQEKVINHSVCGEYRTLSSCMAVPWVAQVCYTYWYNVQLQFNAFKGPQVHWMQKWKNNDKQKFEWAVGTEYYTYYASHRGCECSH